MKDEKRSILPPEYGACRACHRVFVVTVTDKLTQCLHDSAGYCPADVMWKRRNGITPEHRYISEIRPGEYRDPVPHEITVQRLGVYVLRRRARIAARRQLVV